MVVLQFIYYLRTFAVRDGKLEGLNFNFSTIDVNEEVSTQQNEVVIRATGGTIDNENGFRRTEFQVITSEEGIQSANVNIEKVYRLLPIYGASFPSFTSSAQGANGYVIPVANVNQISAIQEPYYFGATDKGRHRFLFNGTIDFRN